MQIYVVSSANKSTEKELVDDIKQQLDNKNSEKPSFLWVTFSENLDFRALQKLFVQNFPDSVITGVCSEYGSFDANNCVFNSPIQTPPLDDMNNFGSNISSNEPNSPGVVASSEVQRTTKLKNKKFSVKKFTANQTSVSKGIFVTAFYDRIGAFGNAIATFNSVDSLKFSQTYQEAAYQADRPGIMPVLISMFNTMNVCVNIREEFENTLGTSVPVIGGILNTNRGLNKVFTQKECVEHENLYIITCFYVNCDIRIQNYSPIKQDGNKGRVTSANGNIINTIENQPAADFLCKLMNFESTKYSVEELNNLVPEYQIQHMIAKLIPSVSGDRHYNVSIIKEVTPDRGVATANYWKDGEIVNLVHGLNDELYKAFVPTKFKSTDKIIAVIYIMCASFCEGENATSFTSELVPHVRSINGNKSFVVCSAGGEYGKDINDPLTYVNYTVSTLCFLEREDG